LLNLRRTKALSRNAEDLHGSARWATAEDVRATGLLDSKQGAYVGSVHNFV
jgi:type IV secretory pathway TraG/TraD family ATPase VirD4